MPLTSLTLGFPKMGSVPMDAAKIGQTLTLAELLEINRSVIDTAYPSFWKAVLLIQPEEGSERVILPIAGRSRKAVAVPIASAN